MDGYAAWYGSRTSLGETVFASNLLLVADILLDWDQLELDLKGLSFQLLETFPMEVPRARDELVAIVENLAVLKFN